MLILWLLFASIRTLYGAPVSPTTECPVLVPRDSETHLGERGINDIVVSCFATILACTWSAVHLPVPLITQTWISRFIVRIAVIAGALLAPELLVAVALWERQRAKEITNEYNDYITSKYNHETSAPGFKDDVKSTLTRLLDAIFLTEGVSMPLPTGSEVPYWTLTHGFFVQMGGFMLCENGIPKKMLSMKTTASGLHFEASLAGDLDLVDFMQGLRDETVDLPKMLSRDDILDRSKSDEIAKTFVVLQTTWFILQCIVRWANRLPVTQLEVLTLGFAVLNGLTYWIWWDKPQNVGRPIFVEIKPTAQTSGETSDAADTADAAVPEEVEDKTQNVEQEIVEVIITNQPTGETPAQASAAAISAGRPESQIANAAPNSTPDEIAPRIDAPDTTNVTALGEVGHKNQNMEQEIFEVATPPGETPVQSSAPETSASGSESQIMNVAPNSTSGEIPRRVIDAPDTTNAAVPEELEHKTRSIEQEILEVTKVTSEVPAQASAAATGASEPASRERPVFPEIKSNGEISSESIDGPPDTANATVPDEVEAKAHEVEQQIVAVAKPTAEQVPAQSSAIKTSLGGPESLIVNAAPNSTSGEIPPGVIDIPDTANATVPEEVGAEAHDIEQQIVEVAKSPGETPAQPMDAEAEASTSELEIQEVAIDIAETPNSTPDEIAPRIRRRRPRRQSRRHRPRESPSALIQRWKHELQEFWREIKQGYLTTVKVLNEEQFRYPSLVVIVCGTIFGCVHLIPGWFIDFASPVEKWLWRVSSIVLTLEPILCGLVLLFAYAGWDYPTRVVAFLAIVFGLLFVISRHAITGLSLVAFRSLPPGALQTIEWTSFIPHF